MSSTLQPLKLETHLGRHAAQRQDTSAIELNVPNLVWQVWLLALTFNAMTAIEVLA